MVTDTLALWILFGLLSVAFVAMQFAFRRRPRVSDADMLAALERAVADVPQGTAVSRVVRVPNIVDFIGDIKIVPWGMGTADITRWPDPRP